MKIKIMRKGDVRAGESYIILEYETSGARFVRLETSTGFVVRICEQDGSFSICSARARLSILPSPELDVIIGR